MNPKEERLKLNRFKLAMRRLLMEWSEMERNASRPMTRKWYGYFARELSEELRKVEIELDKVKWVEVED
jgi:hypothetical protein